MLKVKANEMDSFETLFRRFKKKVMNEGTLDECRKREYFMTDAEKRELKHKENVRRMRKAQAKALKNNIKY